jgi:hypothetical protein
VAFEALAKKAGRADTFSAGPAVPPYHRIDRKKSNYL